MSLVPLAVSASFLEKAQIETAARGFLSKGVGAAVLEGRALSSVEQRGNLWIARYSPSGHAVFSGSDRAEPVVGFSPNDFAEPEEGSAFYDVLEGASEGCARLEAEEEESEAMAARRVKWRQLLGGGVSTMAVVDPQPSAESVIIAPFLTTHWNQCQPYNDYAPVYMADLSSASNYDKYYRGRTPSGCVATVGAQVLNHWRWPARIDCSVTRDEYLTDSSGAESVYASRFNGRAPFDWNALSDSYGSSWFDYDAWAWNYDLRGHVAESNRYAIARLFSLCDTIAEMHFAPIGSGASLHAFVSEIAEWYMSGSEYIIREVADSAYGSANAEVQAAAKEAARADIAAGRPVLVSIPGHAVIGHGWAEDDNGAYIYFNYGFGGSSDGYYNFDDDASDDQDAIVAVYTGLMPRPRVELDPIPSVSSNAVTVSWHAPDCWTNSFSGYLVRGYSVDTTSLSSFTEDFSANIYPGYLGFSSPYGGTHEFDSEVLLTARSVLTYKIKSLYALGLDARVEASFDGGEWTRISEPGLNEEGESGLWMNIRTFLGDRAGQRARFRIAVTWTAGSACYVIDGYDNVLIDDFNVSGVYSCGQSFSASVGPEERSFEAVGLEAGRQYSFSVTPTPYSSSIDCEESAMVATVCEGVCLTPLPGVESYVSTNLAYSAGDAAWSVDCYDRLSDTSFIMDRWGGEFSVAIDAVLTENSVFSFDWTVTGYYVQTSDESRTYDPRDLLDVIFVSPSGVETTLLHEENRQDRTSRQARTVQLGQFAGQSGLLRVVFEHTDLQIGPNGDYGMVFYEPRVSDLLAPVLPEATFATVEKHVCEKAEMLGVSASGPDFQEGFFRECRMDVPSTFEVVCSAATAGLEALPSALSLVPDSAVAIVTNNVADGTRSFTVTINPSIPDAFERTRMILTLAAYDANGDAVYKDLSLRFSKEDFSEPEIAAIAIDSNGGAAGDGNVYVEIPVEWFCSCGLVAATAMPTVEDCIAAANEDADGDGLLNWQEYVCGTDPNNADEKLTAAISFDAAGNVVVESNLTAEQESLANARGFTVKVQGKATLNASESWTEQASTHRFFRIVVERAQ